MIFKHINLYRLHNDEHYQFMTEVKDLVTVKGSDTLKIEDLFTEFDIRLNDEDTSFKLIIKSAATDDIVRLDHLRDGTFRGMVDTNRAALNHYDAEVAEAARQLKVVFDTYGNLSSKSLNAETSGITNLLQELSRSKYLDHVKKVALSGWVNKLTNYNQSVEAMVKQRNAETAGKTHLRMKECRVKTDEAYFAITERINALIVIEGETAYRGFVNQMNTFIDKYNNTIAQRAGHAKAEKEKE